MIEPVRFIKDATYYTASENGVHYHAHVDISGPPGLPTYTIRLGGGGAAFPHVVNAAELLAIRDMLTMVIDDMNIEDEVYDDDAEAAALAELLDRD